MPTTTMFQWHGGCPGLPSLFRQFRRSSRPSHGVPQLGAARHTRDCTDVAKIGDDGHGGQPTEGRCASSRPGVTTVWSASAAQEMTRSVSFDQAALVKSLGMKYVPAMGGSPSSILPRRSGT